MPPKTLVISRRSLVFHLLPPFSPPFFFYPADLPSVDLFMAFHVRSLPPPHFFPILSPTRLLLAPHVIRMISCPLLRGNPLVDNTPLFFCIFFCHFIFRVFPLGRPLPSHTDAFSPLPNLLNPQAARSGSLSSPIFFF